MKKDSLHEIYEYSDEHYYNVIGKHIPFTYKDFYSSFYPSKTRIFIKKTLRKFLNCKILTPFKFIFKRIAPKIYNFLKSRL